MSGVANWSVLAANRSPYTDWFVSKEQDVFYRMQSGGAPSSSNAFTTRIFDTQSFFLARAPSNEGDLSYTEIDSKDADLFGFDTDTIPFLVGSVGAQDVPISFEPVALQDADGLAARLDPKAVLTGVIDVGISPFHERFKATDKTTRILTCWQQAGEFAGNLPFGSELEAGEIDAALAQVPFDEETALREHHVSRPDVLFGAREVDFRAAHGSHIADLAAGRVPSVDAEAKITDPILAVNMPPRYSHGSAGNFLEFFAFAAVVRIVDVADQLWQAMHKETTDTAPVPGGFPLVINLSFGMQAGAKDGSAMFERLVQALVAKRDAPIEIVMPVGNDNLSRGTARALVGTEKNPQYDDLDPQQMLTLDWRVPPGDRSSNFVELWFPAIEATRDDIAFCVVPPQTEPTEEMWHNVIGRDDTGPVNQYMDSMGGAVRLYRVARTAGNPDEIRPQVTIGLMPTEFFGSMVDGTPVLGTAGEWKIMVRAAGKAVNVYAHIQSDQDIRPGRSRPAIRSYFDNHKHETHTHPSGGHATVPSGMPRDSVHLARAFDDTFTHLDNWHEEGPVQRKGTNNAIATTPSIFVIGAYRVSDKTASAFSATVEDERYQEGLSRGRDSPVIEALLPGDDSPMHLGMLGAGSRSGSVVALRGTSSSSALATRALVAWRLEREDGRRGACASCFFKAAACHEGYNDNAPLKIGNGLIYSADEHARHMARITGIAPNPYL